MDASTIAILAAILAIGAALAGLILRQGLRLDARIEQTNERVERTNERIERVEQGQADLRERMAKLEGLLEGLREAIAGRRAA